MWGGRQSPAFSSPIPSSSSDVICCRPIALGPDLQNILRQSYDYLTIMPKLRSTYDGRLIYKSSYEERSDFCRYDSHAKS